MAGPVPSGGLNAASSPRYRSRAAGEADAGAINALLEATPMGGGFALTLERAPDPLAGDFGLSSHHVMVLGEEVASGRLVGLCERSVRTAFVNGAPAALPYLGALRVAPGFRHRVRILRDGFEAVRRLGEQPGDLPFALTSIAADNTAALRLLTRGLAGLPAYRPAGDYVTFVLRARRQRPLAATRRASAADLPAIAALLNRENARFQFAPAWSAPALASLSDHGLKAEHFLVAGDGARLTGCIAAWDQSSRRQTVLRGYPRGLSMLRPLWNLVAPVTGLPGLPPAGSRLNQVALSHCAVAEGHRDLFLALVDAALGQAGDRGFDSGFIGLAAANPLADALKRRRRAIAYRTVLHTVHWPDQPAPTLDGRPAQPEAALL